MASGDERPWHELLVDDEHADRMADLDPDTVGPLSVIRTVLRMAGEDEDGNPRLPALAEIYESLMKLPTSVNARRAQLAADAMARDPWKPKPSSEEWDPDRRSREGERGEVGLPRRGER